MGLRSRLFPDHSGRIVFRELPALHILQRSLAVAIPFFLRPSLCLSVCQTAVGRLDESLVQVLVGSCSDNDAICTDDDDDVDDDL